MLVRVARTDRDHRIDLLGELDREGAVELRRCVRHLETAIGDRAVLGCAGLSFVDARGLTGLVDARAYLGGNGVSLGLAEPTPLLCRMLAATRLTGILPIVF
ncbi:STAS domain-containing protein [Cryptosporangium phraense]|nr:STAS domain-containing protein [Cryptosporangium phraense]